MLLGHHAVPLAASHLMVVIVADEGIALEEALAFISPYIRLRIALLVEGVVLCLGKIHLVQIAHHLDREEDDLAIGIVIGCRQTVVLAQRIGFELEILIYHLLPFSVFQTVGVLVEHLRGAAAVVLADEVKNAGCFISLRFTKLLCAPVAGMTGDVVYIVFTWIPSHVHKLADRIFHRLEVAHIENPETVNAILVSKRQLLPRILHRSYIEHL